MAATKQLKGRLVYFPDGSLGPATIVIKDGKIQLVHHGQYTETQTSDANEVIDAGNLLVMPGLVDSHVHVNEPGRTDWEGYETATKAAAAGGITTIVDMPLNSIPSTTTLDAFKTKLHHARDQCYVDVAFWGGVVPNNEFELQPMIKAGVVGFKCFLIHSGVDEFPHVTEQDLHKAMEQLQGTDSVLLFHAEVETPDIPTDHVNPSAYSTFLESRPPSMEVEAIRLVCKLCLQYRVRCHIVHLSAADALPLIREAKQGGAPLSVETCHHYLCLDAEHVPSGATQYKCCPPIRSKRNQDILWQALKSGDIDMVISDHSPCTPNLKLLDRGDFMAAWGGISSLQFGLSLFWTNAQQKAMSLADVVKLQSQNTAKLCKMDHRKGAIAQGYDADFVIWDPYASFTVTKDIIQHKNKVTPYLGCQLQGVVHKTIVGGKVVYEDGKIAPKPMGHFLLAEQ